MVVIFLQIKQALMPMGMMDSSTEVITEDEVESGSGSDSDSGSDCFDLMLYYLNIMEEEEDYRVVLNDVALYLTLQNSVSLFISHTNELTVVLAVIDTVGITDMDLQHMH
ncbi:MAG: hypothetical protein EZS28_022845 [Streblomastix strix]|uniref:Uncharacterized protein n=1 Tax=Streblomastix strix TaxID=222440 RepID=A0A5J4VGI8_9EUKA|nr:MAG: hypothetical protein EZS28_022845 [Streblomastix strix]